MSTTIQSPPRRAVLYRMVMDKHVCPYGLKARHLLRQAGLEVEDHRLTTRQQTDEFQREQGVETTPQTFIDGRRIGGYEDLRSYLGRPLPSQDQTSFTPVMAVFGMAALMAVAATWASAGTVLVARTAEWFVSFSMCILAIQKLRDLESFSTMFLSYDLLARRWVPYASLYPWGEALAGVLMVAGLGTWVAAPVALFLGSVGAASVTYAVYIQKRELRCACVGGGTKVPLGFVSLAENLMMVAVALWMLVK